MDWKQNPVLIFFFFYKFTTKFLSELIIEYYLMSFNRLKNIFNSKPKKPHLLIAGVDLKFIVPAIKYLEKYYEIKVDEWDWNIDKNVPSKSVELLKWADIILCEWMEYYTPWYSQNVSKNQKLFIRAHRYEITLDYGNMINFENVCGVITINYFFTGDFFQCLQDSPRKDVCFE